MKVIKKNEKILVVLDSFSGTETSPFISFPMTSVNGSLLSVAGLDAFSWDDIMSFYMAIAYKFIIDGNRIDTCPNWGWKNSGAFGPCGECASCELGEFLRDER